MEILKWNDFFKSYDLDPALLNKWLNTIRSRYGEDHRHYHTLSHVNRLIWLLDDNQSLVMFENGYVINYLSILFHDIVYDPHSKTNEVDSVILFEEFINDFPSCFGPEITDQVRKNIESTIMHQPINDLCNIFLDFDLEILSTDWDMYKTYADGIRREYHFVQDFNKKRIQVLQRFLDRQYLYLSPAFRNAKNVLGVTREDTARSNLIREIESLIKLG